MQERKTGWIDHPAFITANEKIRKALRNLAFEYDKAVRAHDALEATSLIDEAKQIKWDNFPFEIIRGGKS